MISEKLFFSNKSFSMHRMVYETLSCGAPGAPSPQRVPDHASTLPWSRVMIIFLLSVRYFHYSSLFSLVFPSCSIYVDKHSLREVFDFGLVYQEQRYRCIRFISDILLINPLVCEYNGLNDIKKTLCVPILKFKNYYFCLR